MKRIEWVDIGKYICIMFVMLSHLESCTEVLRLFFTPFFLTVFFFLSGYVFREPQSFKEHLIKKTRGLLIPWFIFSNLNILLSAMVSLRDNVNPLKEFGINLLQIRGYGDGVWFVAALFIAYIPFYFMIKMNRPKATLLLSLMLSVLSMIYINTMPTDIFPWNKNSLPWHLEYIFQAVFWMMCGYYFNGTFEHVFDKYNKAKARGGIVALYLLLAFLPAEKCWEIPLSYARSILGISAVIGFSKILNSNRYIAFVGSNTIIFFALHGKLYTVIQAVLERFSLYQICLNNTVLSSLVAVAITIIMSVLLIIPAEIINKWFPWMVGRSKRAKEISFCKERG